MGYVPDYNFNSINQESAGKGEPVSLQ